MSENRLETSKLVTMNTITVYENPKFQGLIRQYTEDVLNLVAESFDNCISSAKVEGNPWLMYEHPNYKGWCTLLEEGEHPAIGMNDKASSLKLITEDLSTPKITVYEHENATGSQMVLTQETNLTFGNMNNKISSHRVQSGVWLLYEHPNRKGRFIVARAGEYLAKYSDVSLDNKISHVYPLRPGKPSVTATLLWDQKKVESQKNIQADQYVYTNNTDSEQEFTATSCKEYEKYVTHSFEFSKTSSVTVGSSFTLAGVASISAEASHSFTVKKDESESLTTRKKADLSLPMKVPPRTKVTVSFMSKEVTVSVPVELSIFMGSKTVIERGTYHCDSGTDTCIDVQSDPIPKV